MPAWKGEVKDLNDAVTFHQFLLMANNRSLVTQRQYRYYEELFLDFLHHRKIKPELTELNVHRVREFLIWYRSQSQPGRTRDGEVAVRAAAENLKRLGAVLEANDYFDVNPLRKLMRPATTKYVRVPFTPQEINAMWGACFRTQNPARDEALFLLLLDTGMRIGEVCSLRLDKLDLNGRVATIMGKGRRERNVPIGDSQHKGGGRVIRALQRHLSLQDERWADTTPYVFVGRSGRRLTPEGGNTVIKRIAELAGVEDAYPHRIRHTFCTWYLTVYPGDELGLRRIVGHVSRNVLSDYVHFAQATIAERSGRASLAETWLGSAPITNRTLLPLHRTEDRTALPTPRRESRNRPAARPTRGSRA